MSPKLKRLSAALSAVAVLGVPAGLWLLRDAAIRPFAEAHAANAPPAAVDVAVATVLSRTITDWQGYSGRSEAVDHVDVRPLVPGTFIAVHFTDGALVKKDDALFTIDPRPHQAAVDRAPAQLTAAKARALYTSTEEAPAERLLADNAIAKRDYDEKQNAAREAAETVKAADAALEAAQVNLGYTKVTAPTSGRVPDETQATS